MSKKNMAPEEVFTRSLFGIIMMGAAFVGWGKWITFILGFLFIISALQGYCVTCAIYRWMAARKK